MKREVKLGIFVLVVVLSAFFILATSYNKAPASTSAGSTISMVTFDVSNTTGLPNWSNFTNVTIAVLGTVSVGNLSNITISNGTDIYWNDTFTTSPVVIIINNNFTTTTSVNWTVNFTLKTTATYNKTVGANVTAIGNVTSSNLSYSVLPYNSSLTIVSIETTAPVATATCSPKEIYETETFPCTCSGTDSGDAASGVDTNVGSSNSPDGISTPLTIGTFTYTCTVTDNADNSASDTETYTVLNVGGGGGAGTSLPKNTHSFSKITPGVVSIMKDFDSEIGVKQIQIEVNNEAQNVKITVTKYDGKPAEVSVSKSGKVYQYLQISEQNLGTKLDKATVQFRVEKSWASSNGLDKAEVSVYKFDESSSKWNELTTTFASEDSTYYYYDAELDSFSYFAISERSLVGGEGTTATGETPTEGRSLTWLWILIALVIVVVVWLMMRKRQ
ncbi:MAG TPA: PGF-pre-PGF domain-containing protein [Candidatus Nanoarchaeia archaeon]|nr:PGF-pre-PGF domain-containing protein [Candidatus Nanoarchaeia archaeon]